MNSRNTFKLLLNERAYNYLFYYYNHLKGGRFPKAPNFVRPVTFNEKIIWLKMNQRYQNAHILADKVLVKDFVKGKIGGKYVIPTIAVFSNISEIDFDVLPDSFVLKANHGSGWNIFCPDKRRLDLLDVRNKLNSWLNTNYYNIGKEYQYRKILPKIICETYLENTTDKPLIDYKIFCFSGNPLFIQVDLDRFTNHTRNFYDKEWNLMPFTTLYPLGIKKVERPGRLDEMLYIAHKLSEDLKFARIDLYFHNGNIYFGEITLHHGGGFEPFMPSEYDALLGQYISL